MCVPPVGSLLVAMTLCSCIYEYPDKSCFESHDKGMSVLFDWTGTPAQRPEGMTVMFYPADGGDSFSYNLGCGGGTVSLPHGLYDAVAYNNDSPSVIVISDGHFGTLAFTTRPGRITDGVGMAYAGAMPPVTREESRGQTVMRQPDMFYSAVSPGVVSDAGNTVIMKPRCIVARYRIKVRDVVNPGSATRMSVSLSGLAGQYHAASGIARDEVPVIVPATVSHDGDGGFSGSMLTFGRAPTAGVNMLRLYVWLADGQKKVFEWDVARQILDASDPMDVTIVVGGVQLPDVSPDTPPGSGSGMEVDVDNWDIVDIELST